MNKILITGASGYLGAQIARDLTGQGLDVRLGCHSDTSILSDYLPGYERIRLDLFDTSNLNVACKGISTVIHLAGLNAAQCKQNPEMAIKVNSLGTYNLLQASVESNVEKFLYFSTAHVYGSALLGNVSEHTVPSPVHPYGITKRMAEDWVMYFTQGNSIKGTVFRLTNTLGSPVSPAANCWMLVANDLCKQLVESGKMIVNSPPNVQRDYISLSEVSLAVYTYLTDNMVSDKSVAEIINISGGRSLTLQQLANKITSLSKSVLNINPDVFFKNSQDSDSCASEEIKLSLSNKHARELGYKLCSSLDQALSELLVDCNRWFPQKS